MTQQTQKTSIYAVRTTSGQERTVVDLMASRAQVKKLPITSILAPEVIKGYIFVEANGPHFVDEAIAGTRHARTRTKGVVSIQAIERFIVTKPVIEELSVGNLVEVVGGPFRGLRAKITHVDKVKQEVVIELLEEGFATLPITVHADYVKLVSRGEEDSGREENRSCTGRWREGDRGSPPGTSLGSARGQRSPDSKQDQRSDKILRWDESPSQSAGRC